MKVASPLIVNPGSEQIRATAERDGMIAAFEDIGATIMANACGPCIGQWKRHTDDPGRKNSIVTSFNRNFAKRADGNPNTFAYVASPEITMALTIAGDLCFDPLRDTLVNAKGEVVKLSEPVGEELPATRIHRRTKRIYCSKQGTDGNYGQSSFTALATADSLPCLGWHGFAGHAFID